MSNYEKSSTLVVGPLSVVYVLEDGYWLAQCLEYDIVAQAKTMKDLPEAFALVFASHVSIRLAHQQDPFEGVPPAPAKYWDLHREGMPLKGRAVRVPIATSGDMPSAHIPFQDARVSA